MGWNSMEETRVLVDVSENVTLLCEFIINNQSVISFTNYAVPGIPIVYIFYNIPPKSHCRLIWNDTIEIEFLINHRLRIPGKKDDSFPLVVYNRFDLNDFIRIQRPAYIPRDGEKVVVISGNCHSGGVEGWINMAKTRPSLVIHNGYHIDYRDLLKSYNKGILPIRTLWKRIRDKIANAWRENEVKSIIAVTSNVLTNDVKPYTNFHLMQLNIESFKQLCISACSSVSSYVTSNINLNFDETVFILSLMYFEVLWRDIPYEYDGSYKNFMIGNKHYFILDSKYYRNEHTLFGVTQLSYFDKGMSCIEPGSNIVIIVPNNPFNKVSFKRATPKIRDKWGYSKRWIDEFVHLITYCQKYKVTFIGSGYRDFLQELYFNHCGSILRSYILPPIRHVNYNKTFPRLRKRLSEYILIHSNIQQKFGYLIIDNELCFFLKNN